ncbi:MAG: hypothetical protein C0598_07240, partial [Marinilabiliales bacterium]
YFKNGRLTHTNYPKDWEKYWGGEVVIDPVNMSREEFIDFTKELTSTLYNYKRFMKMFMQTLKTTKNAKAAVWAFSTNLHYHNMSHQADDVDYIKIKELYDTLIG